MYIIYLSPCGFCFKLLEDKFTRMFSIYFDKLYFRGKSKNPVCLFSVKKKITEILNSNLSIDRSARSVSNPESPPLQQTGSLITFDLDILFAISQ